MDVKPADAELEPLLSKVLRLVTPARGGPTGGDDEMVSVSEARALVELLAARGIAQGELGSLLGLEKSTVSRLAAGLERKGWLRRGRDEENQRFVRLYLTPEGRAVAGRLWRAWQSRQQRILASMSAEERAGLAAGLRGLVRGLTAEGLLGETAPAPGPVPQAASETAPPAGHEGPAEPALAVSDPALRAAQPAEPEPALAVSESALPGGQERPAEPAPAGRDMP